ncbi:MAG: ABC transporter substrate-binding protein [Desulfamplus sp.]|nr:ABC transporter substrate-binding protein [Desulfamplus sp.]
MKNKKFSKIIKWFVGITFLIAGISVAIFVNYRNQNPSRKGMVTIGISRWGSNPEYERCLDGFMEGLAEHGYIAGKNVRYVIKNPEADKEEQRRIIESFIKDKVDLIFSLTTPGTLIAKELTGRMKQPIPVVFSICTYPVESGLIKSLESSGNNLVGTRNYVPPSKQYLAFEELYPDTKFLAVVRRKGEPNSTNQFTEISSLLERRGIKIVDIAVVDLEDMYKQLQENIDRVDALFSTCDTLVHGGGEEIINEFSSKYKKPNFSCNKDGVLKGALVGNIGDFKTIGRISGEKAVLILQGSDPSWLHTESPREDYIIVNKKTADMLGITIPEEFLKTASEIISK